MNKLVLRLFDLFTPLVRLMGADVAQCRAILEVKLTLDGRRQTVMARKSSEHSNLFVTSLALNAFLSLALQGLLFQVHSPLVRITIAQSFLMMMLGMSLVADFSSVLLDTTDNAILQPRPVSPRTVLMARLIHIVVYLTLMSLSLSAATLIAEAIRIGPLVVPVFLGTLVCAVCLVLLLVNVVYLGASRLMSHERIRDLITYAQVALSVIIVLGFQILPRLIDMKDLRNVEIAGQRWTYFFPPAWLAAPIDLVAGHMHAAQWTLAALAVVVPVVGLFFLIRYLSPAFNRILASMDAGPARVTRERWNFLGAASIASRLICRTPAARAAFELVWNLCARDRQFKQRAYSGVAFLFIYILIFLVAGQTNMREALAGLHLTQKYLIALYLPCLVFPSVLMILRYSDQWQAAWVFQAIPVRTPGEILLGAWTAVMMRIAVPCFAIITAVTLAIWGTRITLDIVFAACVTAFACSLYGLMMGRHLPFSEALAARAQSGRMVWMFFLFLLLGALSGAHYLLRSVPLALMIGSPVVLLLTGGVLRTYARRSWDAVAT